MDFSQLYFRFWSSCYVTSYKQFRGRKEIVWIWNVHSCMLWYWMSLFCHYQFYTIEFFWCLSYFHLWCGWFLWQFLFEQVIIRNLWSASTIPNPFTYQIYHFMGYNYSHHWANWINRGNEILLSGCVNSNVLVTFFLVTFYVSLLVNGCLGEGFRSKVTFKSLGFAPAIFLCL